MSNPFHHAVDDTLRLERVRVVTLDGTEYEGVLDRRHHNEGDLLLRGAYRGGEHVGAVWARKPVTVEQQDPERIEFVRVDEPEPSPFHCREFRYEDNAAYVRQISERAHVGSFPIVREADPREIVAGHKRFWVAGVAGLDAIPARIVEWDDWRAAVYYALDHLPDLDDETSWETVQRFVEEWGDRAREIAPVAAELDARDVEIVNGRLQEAGADADGSADVDVQDEKVLDEPDDAERRLDETSGRDQGTDSRTPPLVGDVVDEPPIYKAGSKYGMPGSWHDDRNCRYIKNKNDEDVRTFGPDVAMPNGDPCGVCASDYVEEENDTGDARDVQPEDSDDIVLAAIQGVGEAKARALRDAGFGDDEAIRGADQGDLAAVDGVADALAARIKAEVGDAAAPEDDGEDPVDCKDADCSETFESERAMKIHFTRVHGARQGETSIDEEIADVLGDHGELPAKKIKLHLETSSSHFRNVLSKMQRDGRVESRRDPDDGRRNLYRLAGESIEEDGESSVGDSQDSQEEQTDQDVQDDQADPFRKLWCGHCSKGPYQGERALKAHHGKAGHEGEYAFEEEPPEDAVAREARGYDSFPRDCGECGVSCDSSLEWKVHRVEEHDVDLADHTDPGEFEEIVERADSLSDIVDDTGWSPTKVLRVLGVYGLDDLVVGGDVELSDLSEWEFDGIETGDTTAADHRNRIRDESPTDDTAPTSRDEMQADGTGQIRDWKNINSRDDPSLKNINFVPDHVDAAAVRETVRADHTETIEDVAEALNWTEHRNALRQVLHKLDLYGELPYPEGHRDPAGMTTAGGGR